MRPDRSLVVPLLLVGALFGCSGASANEPDTSHEADGSSDASPVDGAVGQPNDAANPDAGMNLGWTNQTNIEGIFETYCASCHGVQWSSCWNVRANAGLIDEMVSSGAMPRNGPLPSSVEATLLAWLGAGAPCSGSPQPFDAGQGPPPPP